MYRFNCDYLEGAHPDIIKRLVETNMEQSTSYGFDDISNSAKEKIRQACGSPDADVFFLIGGTQANLTVLDSILKNYEGVISADTGHIGVHEAGAIEHTGHKVIALPSKNSKLNPDSVKKYMENFYKDETNLHMVKPGAVYISHPSEYGMLYTKKELNDLYEICKSYGMKLYLDGARLGYGLASPQTDVTLKDIAHFCDVFYIGGTKVGALLGEAVVFTDKSDSEYFFTRMKQKGAHLAKGRILGIQFDELFNDGLYYRIGDYAVSLAMKIKNALIDKGYTPYMDSYTNQQFFIIPKEKYDQISKDIVIDNWGEYDNTSYICRITTSWATRQEAVEYLIAHM